VIFLKFGLKDLASEGANDAAVPVLETRGVVRLGDDHLGAVFASVRVIRLPGEPQSALHRASVRPPFVAGGHL